MTKEDLIDGDVGVEREYLPSEGQLTLLCLDYLRDLRRTYIDPQDLLDSEGLHADWLTLAIYALNRSFSMQGPLKIPRGKSKDELSVNYNQVTMPVFNDSWMDSHRVLTDASPTEQEEMMNPTSSPQDFSSLPTLNEMTRQILISKSPGEQQGEEEEKKSEEYLDSYAKYVYDDAHPSNANRFYLLDGLAGSSNGRGPLLLGEVAAAGLSQLRGRARLVAEDEMVKTELFEQFVWAVEGKGFFQDPEHETPRDDPQQEEERVVLQKAVYDERMGKVVSKFRSKLASKIEIANAEDPNQEVKTISEMTCLADYHHNRRMKRVILARKQKPDESQRVAPSPKPPASSMPPTAEREEPSVAEAKSRAQAERLKSKGNTYMQKKKYDDALECYTEALRLSPSGPQSHVYFSNRAAALLSMKKFDKAILDSERAIALAPSYGKAHARLGLAHFLLGDYRPAMEAYTVALKYEPENKSSKSYLEKAAKKLAAMGQPDVPEPGATLSYSGVTEWEKSNGKIEKEIGKTSSTRRGQSGKQNRKPDLNGMSVEAAEKHKNLGNVQMAKRDYKAASESYSTAIELSPDGPQSHVYYSNRAAALCYLDRYEEAVRDSEVAINLKPTYGKAYARLGLSKFFMSDYAASIEAYETALKYDPDNAASKSYLAKARIKLERQQKEDDLSSFNVSDEARRLMADDDMMKMAKKMLKNGNQGSSQTDMLNDPEMKQFAKKATKDPTMMEAFRNMHTVNARDF
ncbi:unnamed protein product [Pseudo-nitzschia multistriata]|uniref:Uncharacterized protein n=1 Tax=Pseudo-nitzschia multistriata TaxID=183589 RepID=A0A448Z3F5_9STRA|nr:unnamed protein product [Pseudo-nitzschia multistriata]